MRKIEANGVELAYVEHGPEAGNGRGTVVFSHSYLVDHRHFETQIERLADHYRVIAYDHRDHGQSQRTPVRYGLEDLVADAEAIIRATNAAPCHFVGLSTGGFVGLRLALRHPELLSSLVLMDTSAESEPLLKRLKYQAMFAALRYLGFGPLVGTTMRLMFGPALLDDPSRGDEVALWSERIQNNDVQALIRFGNAIFDRESLLSELGNIKTPTQVIVGEHDRPQPPARAQRIAAGVDGAAIEIVPGAGHLSSVDAPEFVNSVLVRFLADVATTP